ncbi:MAG: methylated-DNA--[protein]-cysteine S-methyltransferase [Clostridia bacterium]|nr:methylated-DNA--[protein]-cysteine S-methyltransferase [Clostridia bacterium]
MIRRVIESPVGFLGLYAEDGKIVAVTLSEKGPSGGRGKILDQAEEELGLYFQRKLECFTVPWRLDMPGFEGDCLRALSHVPYGETVSYGLLAAMAGSPRGARAAGNAVHKNPLPVLIPCHRVILGNGRLGGFGGDIAVKKKLLELEGVKVKE